MKRNERTEQEYRDAAKNAKSIAEMCKLLGRTPCGAGYSIMKKKIEEYNIDTSHFTGQRWNKGQYFGEKTCLISLDDILNNNVEYKSLCLKERLFNTGLKERKCEKCGCGEEWCGEKLSLELHHIDGNHKNNVLENLQILCPNCHSQTKGFRERKDSVPTDVSIKKKKERVTCICEECGKKFKRNKKQRFCSTECYSKYRQKINKTYNIDRKNDILKSFEKFGNNKTLIAEEIGISRTLVREYLRILGLDNK